MRQAVREGVRNPLLPALFLGLVSVCFGADHSLVNARRAQALLGSDVWSEVIRIENDARNSRYPRSLHALVFELAGILWFYTEADGTQSFSLHQGQLAAEKANYAPLLRDIEPGFTRWTAVAADVAAGNSLPPEAPLPNGCFIESYAALRMLVARGVPVREPRLLSYYAQGKVRQAGHTVLAYAVDRAAIVEHLRRGLAEPATGVLSQLSWAAVKDLPDNALNPEKARHLLDEAGHRDPDGDGPLPRFTLTLKVSNSEFNRLQSSVIQQNLRDVGIQLDVRTYEFATLYADVIAGNFQLYTLQWTAGALADPDILRRIFHSKQVPPAGFNRGRYSNPQVDALLERAADSLDAAERLSLYGDVQRLIANDVPYVSLWYKTNVAVAQAGLTGIRLSPIADFTFLKEVARSAAHSN